MGRLPGLENGAYFLFKLPVAVQQVALCFGLEQALVLVLAVEIHKEAAYFRKLRQSGRRAVYGSLGAALRVGLAADRDRAILYRPASGEPGRQVPGEEIPLHLGRSGAGPEDIGTGTLAQQIGRA